MLLLQARCAGASEASRLCEGVAIRKSFELDLLISKLDTFLPLAALRPSSIGASQICELPPRARRASLPMTMPCGQECRNEALSNGWPLGKSRESMEWKF